MAKNHLAEDVVYDLDHEARKLVARAKKLHEGAASGQELARSFIAIRELMDAMASIWDELKETRDRLAQEWIPEAFEATGVKTVTLSDGYRVTVQALVRASTRNMEEAIGWMKANGYPDVPKLTINASTLAGIARHLAEQNKQLPEDIFNVHFGSNTSVTKL